MKRGRGKWFSWLTDSMIWLSRKSEADAELLAHARSMDFSSSTTRMGLRLTDWLRDRFRRRWLRIRKTNPSADHVDEAQEG